MKVTLFTLLILLFFSLSAHAEADGPDYFRVRDGQAVAIHESGAMNSPVVIQLPAGTSGLKNMGCTGGATFAQWQEMNAEEREAAKDKIWCKVSIDGQEGWVQNKYLAEYGLPSLPTFDCTREHMHEIEELICNDPALILLDHRMDVIYQQALAVAAGLDTGADEAVKSLEAYQRGWIGGRNECWKDTENKTACAKREYGRHMSRLQAQWMLVPASDPVSYVCDKDGRDEFIATFYATTPLRAAAVERGDKREIFVSTPAASGARYDGDFGKTLWTKGDEALFIWDQFQPAKHCKQEIN